MTDYFFPVDQLPTPAAIVRRKVSNGATLRSALSFGTQTISRAGEHWEIDAQWLNLSGDTLADLLGFIERVNGPEHRVIFHAFDWVANRGAWSGSPVVDGASQVGTTMNITGATASVTNWARPGDFFYMVMGDKYELRRIVAPADTDGSGETQLEFSPALRASPASGEALISGPNMYGKYILGNAIETQMSAPDGVGSTGRVSSVAVTMVEATTG